MKHKLLLAGHNTTILDDFFYAMDDEFECLTTSNRTADIMNHIFYFEPEFFVYCFTSETKDDILKLTLALEKIEKSQKKMILIGYPEPCDEFLRLNQDLVKLIIYRPATANTIKAKLLKFFQTLETQTTANQVESTLSEPVMEPQQEQDDNSFVSSDIDILPFPLESLELKRILIIDDDPLMLSLIKSELKDQYNVATAINGRIGLNFLECKHADLILLDYEMPQEDGPAIFAQLRANPATQDIPVVFLTGINDKDKIQKVLAMKPQGYLLKPIDCERLVKIIHQIIG